VFIAAFDMFTLCKHLVLALRVPAFPTPAVYIIMQLQVNSRCHDCGSQATNWLSTVSGAGNLRAQFRRIRSCRSSSLILFFIWLVWIFFQRIRIAAGKFCATNVPRFVDHNRKICIV
jgi:hypothetical protein